jgi:hypothetical protein
MIPNLRKESIEKIEQYRNQRFGTVVDTFIKTTRSRGNKEVKIKCLKILWDGMQTPSDHAQMRICHEKDYTTILESYGNSIGA